MLKCIIFHASHLNQVSNFENCQITVKNVQTVKLIMCRLKILSYNGFKNENVIFQHFISTSW